MKRFYLAAAAALVLTSAACTPARTIEAIETVDAAAEPQVDQTLAFTVKRLCSLPTDVMARQAEISADTAKGIYYLCNPVRRLVMAILRSIGANDFTAFDLR